MQWLAVWRTLLLAQKRASSFSSGGDARFPVLEQILDYIKVYIMWYLPQYYLRTLNGYFKDKGLAVSSNT